MIEEPDTGIASEAALAGAALALGAREVPGWSAEETALARERPPAGADVAGAAERPILAGPTPSARPSAACAPRERRRPDGATYTPPPIVEAMVAWAAARPGPARVVDPGAGSGRFAVAAGRRFPRASLLAVERDPLAALVCRGHLAAAGLAGRARVVADDYRSAELGRDGGPDPLPRQPARTCATTRSPRSGRSGWRWRARSHGLEASQLAGLHVHFFLATAGARAPGRRAARSSPPRSGSTPTTAAWCASCCSARSAARRSTCSSPRPPPSRTRP